MWLFTRLIVDAAVITAAYYLTLAVNSKTFVAISAMLDYYKHFPGILTIHILSLAFWGMYKTRKGFLVEVDEFIGCFVSTVSSLALLLVATFIRDDYLFARPEIFLTWPIILFLLTAARQFVLKIELISRARGLGSKRAAIIGSDNLAELVANKIKNNSSYGFNFIGFVSLANLAVEVMEKRIQMLFITDQAIPRTKLAEIAAFCDQNNIELGTIPDVFEILTTSPSVEDINGFPIVRMKTSRFTLINKLIKRAFDIFLSLFGLIVFAIPMFVISLLVKIFSPGGPLIYKQTRVGRKGREFKVYKFRTMIPNAEKDTGAVLATADDSRKTNIGRFLRKTNLDELPQLFNIIKGDMSFVGPRPERPIFVDKFKSIIPKYMDRHSIRPGLAGWAQLHGGYHMPAGEKIKYDLYYIENWSLLLDIKIILKYIQIAFTGKRMN